MAPPVLWQFRFSHFNEKARWALDFKGIPHVRRSLVPGLHVPRVLWLSGQKSLPVLQLDGELQPSGYLLGERFSVADLAAAALLAPLVFPPEWPYPLPGPLPARAAALSDAFAAHPGVRWVREMYRRHRGTSAALAA